MSSQLDVRPDVLHLSDPIELSSFFDGYLDFVLDLFDRAEEAEELSNSITSHAQFMASMFTEKTPMVVLDEDDFGDKLALRLKTSLTSDGLITEVLPVVVQTHAQDYVFLAAMLMVRQFVDLIRDSEEKKESPDVFDLRRTALVGDWVNRFLGKRKYAE